MAAGGSANRHRLVIRCQTALQAGLSYHHHYYCYYYCYCSSPFGCSFHATISSASAAAAAAATAPALLAAHPFWVALSLIFAWVRDDRGEADNTRGHPVRPNTNRRNKARTSVDRSTKATLILTVARFIFKSFTKDLSGRALLIVCPCTGPVKRQCHDCTVLTRRLSILTKVRPGGYRRCSAWILT